MLALPVPEIGMIWNSLQVWQRIIRLHLQIIMQSCHIQYFLLDSIKKQLNFSQIELYYTSWSELVLKLHPTNSTGWVLIV